jgi:hypothetical protein
MDMLKDLPSFGKSITQGIQGLDISKLQLDGLLTIEEFPTANRTPAPVLDTSSGIAAGGTSSQLTLAGGSMESQAR